MTTIQFKRGLETNRTSIIPSEGELLYITDTKRLWIGDGITSGGVQFDLSSAEILSLIKTVDGDGSGLDGDTLDNLDGSQFIRNDEDGTITADLELLDTTLSSVNSTINANSVVDVFVYDTSQDSDGGQWRKRTQHTSWYNETLNTATRGEAKEFPAVAIIVAEVDKVTIYDATKKDTPMWMVFLRAIDNILHGSSDRSGIKCVNSTFVISSLGNSISVVSFISEKIYRIPVGSYRIYNSNIINRNNVSGWTIVDGDFVVNNTVNDVDVVVLPNAPIDTETGLPIPTIAAATLGGLSVIKDDGNVYDSAITTDVGQVAFINDQIIYQSSVGITNRFTRVSDIPEVDGFPSVRTYGEDTTITADLIIRSNSRLDITENSSGFATGGSPSVSAGLSQIKEEIENASDGMVNITTNVSCSGWMKGDIKGAFLSSIDTSDLIGGSDDDRSHNQIDLIVNGTINRTIVATGAELVGYSGFSASNYLEQPYNSGLDFGTGDFYIMVWVKTTDLFGMICDKGGTVADGIKLMVNTPGPDGVLAYRLGGAAIFNSNYVISNDVWSLITLSKQQNIVSLYANKTAVSVAESTLNTDTVTPTIRIGLRQSDNAQTYSGDLALFRIGAGSLSNEQIEYIYETERLLFQENAKCALTSTNSEVNSLSYDKITKELHVAGSTNLDTFVDLIRTNSETGVYTSLSSQDSVIIKGN